MRRARVVQHYSDEDDSRDDSRDASPSPPPLRTKRRRVERDSPSPSPRPRKERERDPALPPSNFKDADPDTRHPRRDSGPSKPPALPGGAIAGVTVNPAADLALLRGAHPSTRGSGTEIRPVSFDTNIAVDVQKDLVETLMTEEFRKLIFEETGANVQWVPNDRKVQLGGSTESVQKAERLVARVKVHCCWGQSMEKVRRLLKPIRVESVRCHLSPMGDKLPTYRKTLSTKSPLITMGKGPNNDVIMPDPHRVVSRQHCVLEFDEGRGAVYLLDCSTNGMFLNGVKLPANKQAKVVLCHGDEMLFMDPQIPNEFGYIVNLNDIGVKSEMKLEAPRRLLTSDELSTRHSVH